MGAQEQKVQGTANNQGGFLDEIFVKVRDQLKDISYVEVITATGSPEEKIDSNKDNVLDALAAVEILARTTIELDGDIVMIIPTSRVNGELKVNQEIMAIHKQNVDAAVQNWKSFMDTILNAINLIANLAGLEKVDVRTKLGLSVQAPGSGGG
jgi:uncharacterized protein YabN with tetrapyrrole methylase and pyrophosphatase domain